MRTMLASLVVTGVKRITQTLVLAALLGASGIAHAETDEERAGARVAATEGLKAFQEKRWDEALDLFTRAESLVHAPPHLLYMARSMVQMGMLVKARETYMKIIKEQLASSTPRAFRSAQDDARNELQPLESRIPHATFEVKGAKEYRVWVDGKEVPKVLVGLPRPVDPGEHTFQARADGMESKTVKVTFQEGVGQRVVLKLKKLPPGAKPSIGPEEPTPVQKDEPRDDKTGLRIGSYVALGVGGVGLIAGSIFALQSSSKRQEVEDICPNGSPCTGPIGTEGRVSTLNDEAGSASTLSTVSFVVGGVGLAAGATLFFLSNSDDAPAKDKGARVTPWIGLGSAGLSGTF